ncbi:uncharacterized protein [Watersipora subatra]|uniref:uncharacterized protein n=1 Tax=Watersipora subatra TaxID=2589382 RepID=UPI00355B88F0
MDDEDTVDDDLMAQITRELAQLDDNSPLLEDDDHDPPPTVTELSVVPSDSKALEAFEVRLASQREAFDEQLEECAKLLQITQDKIDSSITVSLAELANEYAEAGEDEDTFRARIYAELEAADDSDDDVSDGSLDAEEGEEKTLAGERDRIGDSAEVMGDTPSLAIESALCSQTLRE